jgi:hypothetical protein
MNGRLWDPEPKKRRRDWWYFGIAMVFMGSLILHLIDVYSPSLENATALVLFLGFVIYLDKSRP